MGTLIRFELRKILNNKAGMAACVFALVILAAASALNLITLGTRDFVTGEYVEGIAAQQAVKALDESHAGMLTDERVAADAAVLDRANQLAKETPGFYDLSSDQIISEYGFEFWQETMGVIIQSYYMEVVGTLDSTDPRTSSLQEGAAARIDGALSSGFVGYFPYSDAEKAYWREKAAEVSWPVEYGYVAGWDNVIDWMSISGLVIVAICIALSGAFASEYQSRAAAVVLPTKRGKRALLFAKVIAALVFATVCWWAGAALVLGINMGICGTEGGDLPLQVAEGFGNPYPITTAQAVAALYLLGYVVTLGMAALTLLLSAKMRSTMPVAVIPMAVAFLGLIALFITPLTKVAILTPLSGLNYAFTRMASYTVGSLVLDLPSVLAILYAAMFVVLVPFAMRAFARHQVA